MDYFVLQDSHSQVKDVNVYVQHSGDPDQSTGIMLFSWGEIILQLSAEEITKFIQGISKNWKGKKPEGIP